MYTDIFMSVLIMPWFGAPILFSEIGFCVASCSCVYIYIFIVCCHGNVEKMKGLNCDIYCI